MRGVGVHDVAGDGELSPGRVGRPLGEQRRRARGRRPAADRQLLRLTARRQHPAAQPLRSTSVPRPVGSGVRWERTHPPNK